MALPCDASLPSPGSRWPRFPVFRSTMKALRLPIPLPLGLLFAVRYRVCLLVRGVAKALPSPRRPGRQARIGLKPVIPADCSCHTDGTGSPRFPGRPSRGFAIVPATPAGPWRLVSGGASGAAPTNGTMKAPALDISRLTVRRFATPCVRFATRVTARHATLGPGWRTAPLPDGS